MSCGFWYWQSPEPFELSKYHDGFSHSKAQHICNAIQHMQHRVGNRLIFPRRASKNKLPYTDNGEYFSDAD